MSDNVNHPDHYNTGTIESIDCIKASMSPQEFMGFCKGNALKYIYRERMKGQKESLEKAVWYLNKAIEKYEESSRIK